MSAANPSYDLDALHRAQRAYEPSMEEILASIRNIISEERPAPPRAASAAAAPQVDLAPPVPAAEEPSSAAQAQGSVEALAPPEPPMAVAAPEPVAGPRMVWPRPEVAPEPEFAAPEFAETPASAAHDEAHGVEDEPLISAEADAAITNSFDALSVSVAVQNSTMIADAVRDMIRPMLKAWLDDNLPSIVENLVRAEIQRVARGGR
jgi:hypothetical protein